MIGKKLVYVTTDYMQYKVVTAALTNAHIEFTCSESTNMCALFLKGTKAIDNCISYKIYVKESDFDRALYCISEVK